MGQYCNLISEQNIDNSWSWSSVFQLAQWLFLAQECSDSWFIFFSISSIICYFDLTSNNWGHLWKIGHTHHFWEQQYKLNGRHTESSDSTSIAVAVASAAAVVIIVIVVLIVIFVRRTRNKKWENFCHFVGNPEYSVMIIRLAFWEMCIINT